MLNKKVELITSEQFVEQLDDIIECYSKGDDTHYKITFDGKECLCIPYDGPFTETVYENGEDFCINLPPRVCAKLNIKEGDEVNFEVTPDNNILLTKKVTNDT